MAIYILLRNVLMIIVWIILCAIYLARISCSKMPIVWLLLMILLCRWRVWIVVRLIIKLWRIIIVIEWNKMGRLN